MAGQAEVLIAEISETVVPARLTFRNGGGVCLDALAGNRCLGRIEGLLSQGLSGFADLAGRDLSGADDQMLGQVCALFEAFEGGGEIWVRKQAPEPEASLITGGLSAARLFAGIESARAQASGSGNPNALSNLLGDQATDWMRFRAGAVVETAPGRDAEADEFAAVLQELSEDAADPAGDGLLVVSAPPDYALVIARSCGEALVAKVPADGVDAIAAAWRSTEA